MPASYSSSGSAVVVGTGGHQLHHRTNSQAGGGSSNARNLDYDYTTYPHPTRTASPPSTPSYAAVQQNARSPRSPSKPLVLAGQQHVSRGAGGGAGHTTSPSTSSVFSGVGYSTTGRGYGIRHQKNSSSSPSTSSPEAAAVIIRGNGAMAAGGAGAGGRRRGDSGEAMTYGHSTSNSLSTHLARPPLTRMWNSSSSSVTLADHRPGVDSAFVAGGSNSSNPSGGGAWGQQERSATRNQQNTDSTIYFSPDGVMLDSQQHPPPPLPSPLSLSAASNVMQSASSSTTALLPAYPTGSGKEVASTSSPSSTSRGPPMQGKAGMHAPNGSTYSLGDANTILTRETSSGTGRSQGPANSSSTPNAATTAAGGAGGLSNPNFVLGPSSNQPKATTLTYKLGNKSSPTLGSFMSGAGLGESGTANFKETSDGDVFRFGTASPAAALAAASASKRRNKSISSPKPSHAVSTSASSLHAAADTYLWWWTALLQTSWISRIFVLIVLTEATIDITVESILLARYNTQKSIASDVAKARALPVFFIVFGLAHVYQFFLAVDAVVNKNTILVIGMVIFNGCMLIYSGIQIGEIRDVLGSERKPGEIIPIQVLTGAIPVVVGIAEVAYVVLCWYLWKEFGWRVYKQIGADRGLKKRYLQYQLYVALLKFDFFVFCAFCLQLVLVVLSSTDVERIITIISPVFSLAVLILAWWSVRKEVKWGMYTFMVGLIGALVYFIYKLFRIYQDPIYKEVYKSLTIFSVLSIILLIITFGMTIRCLLNFGRGLRAAIQRITTARVQGHRAMTSNGNIMDTIKNGSLPMTTNGRDAYVHHRLSID